MDNKSKEAQQAETTYNKATKAEHDRDYDTAFRHYVKATELFLYLANSTPAEFEKVKVKWKSSAAKALERAEKIKGFVNKGKKAASQAGVDRPAVLTPVGIDHFSTTEQHYILKKGSIVNGITFPPWSDPLQRGAHPERYKDVNQPVLSPEQQRLSAVWKRPSTSSNLGSKPLGLDLSVLPEEIQQQIVTDCSVCASICSCLEHSRRFQRNLIESIIHQIPKLSPSVRGREEASGVVEGRYDLKFFFNGVWRRVIIDDTLPYSVDPPRLMCMTCTQSPTIFWPGILEKGYMKLMGGYDFPGSNSCIDVHTLLGWIPEHLDMSSASFQPETTWERISHGFSLGRCVLTLGTGSRPNITWNGHKFLSAHSYAVIDIEDDDFRNVKILDSWVEGTEANSPSKTLHIPWHDCLEVFEGIYVNWDTRIWPNHRTHHGMWRLNDEEYSCTTTLRAPFTNPSGMNDEVWVLLTRHISKSRGPPEFICLKTQVDDDTSESPVSTDRLGYVESQGAYTNSPHMLVKVRIPSHMSSGSMQLFLSYDNQEAPMKEVGFSITIYSTSTTFSWDTRPTQPPFTSDVKGSFSTRSSGGNPSLPTFMSNPQYLLRIHPPKNSDGQSLAKFKSAVSLSMQTAKHVPVNITVVWSQGERVFELSKQAVSATSGPYSYGYAGLQKPLLVGDYTVILSPFSPGQTGDYSLKVDSSTPCDLTPIPHEGAGMYTRVLRGAWTTETAMGSPSFHRYTENPRFELEVPIATQVKIRLQHAKSSPAAINVTLYPVTDSSSSSSLETHITTSGGYSDALSGVATPLVPLSAGKYWIVASTYNPGFIGQFQVLVYSKAAVKVSLVTVGMA